MSKMKTKLTAEQLHEAINLQSGKPAYYIEDENGKGANPVYRKGVKEAVEQVLDYDYMWQNCYDDIAFNVTCSQDLTKEEFKKQYRAYRLYMAQTDAEKMELINKYSKK